MSKPKLSKRQREERRQTLRILTGGGALLLAAGAGTLALTQFSDPPALTGASIAGRIEEGGVAPYGLRLRGEAAVPDVVIIGSSDCIHCRGFVAEGLDEFMAVAEELDLSVEYYPLATGLASLGAVRALSCLKELAEPVEVLRATYAMSTSIREQNLTQADFPRLVEEQAQVLGGEVDGAACYAADDVEFAGYSQRLSQAFELQGTPSFYVSDRNDEQTVRVFSGYVSSEATVRQLRRNWEG